MDLRNSTGGKGMTKQDALNIIDAQNKKTIHPVELLHWVWLRVIINQIPEEDWERYVGSATVILAQ
jgi:hypothetical protein